MNVDPLALAITLGAMALYLAIVLGGGVAILRLATRILDRRGPDATGEYGRTPIGVTVSRRIPGGGGW